MEPYLDRVHIEWETSDEADNYALTTEVYEGTDLIYQSPAKQISPTISDDSSSATRLFYFLIPYEHRVALKSGTIYTLRIYPHGYDAGSSTEDFGAFDDLTLRFSGALGLDTDNDGTLDYHDLDSDSDGCPDALEGESSTFLYSDLNRDGSIDTTAFPVDGDGMPGSTDNAIGTSRNNGQQAAECDSCDASSTLFSDNDRDGIGDDCDADDDNDGILDDDEIICGEFEALDLVTLDTADEIKQEPIRNVAGSSTFDLEPSANHTATSADFPKGKATGDIRFSTENSTEVSEYELTFEFPVDIKISQADRGGAFEFRETYSIRAEGTNPSLTVADPGVTDVPSVTGGVTTQYSGNELANITGNGTDLVHFSPATDNAAGNIAPEDSQWSVTATQITKLIIRVVNTSPSQNISKLRIATNCSKLDTDDDGIPNQFDNDSDNDGCPDALEGDGDYTFDDIDQFGKINIGSVNAEGIPNNGLSQGEGSSKDTATQDEECNDACHPNSTLFQDDDGDGVGNACDQDQDNDGILDVDEGFCDATATYSLDIQASFDTNTLGNNGGTMNLVFKLTDGSPLPQIGDEFTVPIFVSDFNNTATNVVHNWDAVYIDDGEFNLVPDEQTFYTDLPPNNQAEIFFGEPGTNLSPIDAVYRFWIESGMLDILGNYKVNIGSLPSSFFLQSSTLSATNQWNLASGGNSYKSGYYSRSTVEGTFRPYDFTFGNNGNYQTYQFEYTAFGNGGATDSNGRRGLVAFSFGEVVYCNPRDSDGDGIPDYLDTDSDNDGCPDALEATSSTFTLADLNPDGSINTTVHPVDTDENSATYGAPGGISNGAGSVQDSSQQGTECDSCNPASSLFVDTDNDGIGNDCDLDDDNDGIWDTEECEAINIENYGTFGWDATGTARDLQNPPGGNYTFAASNSGSGQYAIISRNTSGWHTPGKWEDLAGADTGHDNDAYLAVNGAAATQEVFLSEDIQLPQGIAQTIQVQVANPTLNASAFPIEVGMRLRDDGGAIVASISSGVISGSNIWHVMSLPITPTGTDYTLEMYNISLGASGNDFAVDGIRFSHGIQCQDLDGDGLVESLDLDSDGDSCPDALESRDSPYGIPDLNADGSINTVLHPVDTASNGVAHGVPDGISFGMGTSQDDTTYAETCNYIEVTISGDNDISVIEGEDAVLTIELSEGFPEEITLEITFTNISASDEDYTVTTTVTIPANSTSVDLVIPILDDTIIEPTESFQISISSTHLALDIVEGDATVNIIDNDAAIQPNENYEEDVEIICGDMLPPVPQLTFSGGCHEYEVDFEEQRSDIDESHDYWVIRTWTVTDICGTVEIFEQRIYVTQPDPITVETESCIYDAPVDLLSHLPEGIPDSGTFELLDGDGTLDGSFYDSQNAQTGLHQVYYEVPHENCVTSVIFAIDVNGDCRDDACNFDRMVMPKTITVNGDGINDYFEIKGMEACGYTFQLKVFNRWGTVIYQSDDYDNSWDGTAPENSMGTATHIPAGTYYYIITVPELDYEGRTGYIYIGGL
ncbi:MAG: gliding motility-associated C-terminal domain-containing protein [Flavobacteriaceae bacterium]